MTKVAVSTQTSSMKRVISSVFVLGVALFWLMAVTVAAAAPTATFTVDSTADTTDATPGDGTCDDGSGDCTLRAAIEEANALSGADMIVFDGSLSGSTITLANGELAITEDLTIMGPGAADLEVDGDGASRVFNVASGASVALSGLTVANGGGVDNGAGILNAGTLTISDSVVMANVAVGDMAGEGGGGIFNSGDLTVSDTDFMSNTATVGSGNGGAILNDSGATLVMTGGTISNNSAGRAGGGIEDNASDSVMLTDVDFDGNSAGPMPGNGGALHMTGAGDVMVSGGMVTGNTAAAEGGGFWNGSGTMDVDGTTFDGNAASGGDADQGGGALFNAGGTLTVMNATITNNVADGAAGSGGGILNDMGVLDVFDSSIDSNDSVRAGGGIETNVGDVSLDNVDFDGNATGGGPGNGGAVHVTGAGILEASGGEVTNNTAAAEGGGFWNGSDIMAINGTSFDSNTASGAMPDQGGGALFNAGGTLVLVNATITNNTADGAAGSGGGILNDMGTLDMTDSSIDSNDSVRAGGGIESNIGDVTLENVDFDGNTTGGSPGNGGALHITGAGSLDAMGGDVTNNSAAAEGGGFWNGSGTMDVDGTSFDSNTASGAMSDQGGGALFNAGGTLTVMNTSIMDNVADGAAGSGGGILNDMGSLNVSNSEISGNSSMRAGGGIETNAGDVALDQVVMSDNDTGDSPGNGGALHTTGAGDVSIVESTISDNTAAAEGGGLWNSAVGVMTVDKSTVANNEANGSAADQGGGGLFNDGGTLTVSNSTISSNMVDSAGGGLLNTNGANTLLFNVTFFENDADGMGGGIASDSGSVLLSNSIVAHDMASGDDCSGTITADNPNLDSDGSCGASITADPMLGPLADNGGPTQTHALLSGSPAINSGDNAVCAAPPVNGVDQRGVTRPQGPSCDLGAYETEAATAVTINGLSSDLQSTGGALLLIVGLGALAGMVALHRRRAANS